MKTAIRNGEFVVFDGGQHRVTTGKTIIVDGDLISAILPTEEADKINVDRTIDASDKLVLPGFINLHVHGSIQGPAIYSLDWGRRDMYGSMYVAYQPIHGQRAKLTDKEIETAVLTSVINLVRNGSTTVMELGGIGGSAEVFAELAGKIGLRAYVAYGYRSAEYQFDENGRLHYAWDEEKGYRDFQTAIQFAERYKNSFDGRIKSYLEPRNADTCTPELLRMSAEAAKDLGVLLQIHTAQSVIEFQSIAQRHGVTPVQFLHQNGVLGPKTILGHCVYTTGHSAVAWPGDDDLKILCETGTSVAHCPVVFIRNGRAFESFGRYRRNGVNLGIGTDTFPQDIIHEMRMASYMTKILDRDYAVGTAWDVFNAATLGGARALNREDLGRIYPGAKADLVIVDINSVYLGPHSDPIKTLVHVASGRDVDTVIVNGEVVVDNKRITMLDIDEEQLIHDAKAVGKKLWTDTIWPEKHRVEDVFMP